MAQLKQYVGQIPASLMEDLAFTQPALGLLFNIDTLFLINLQKNQHYFVQLNHFIFQLHAMIVTQMHPLIITCKSEMTPELTASALLAQIGIVHLEF